MCADGTTYALTVRGHLPPDWSDWLDGLTLTPLADGRTRLVGPVRDQAALYGLLIRMRDLGLVLCAVEPLFSDAT